MKKKKNLYVIALVCFITMVGMTIAYFNSTAILDNLFTAGIYKVITHEEFISPDNWKPGDVTLKTITTKNEGSMPVRVRVKLEDSWINKNGNEMNNYFFPEGASSSLDVSIIQYNDMEDWVYDDGYFYYLEELDPGEETSSLIDSVIFNELVPSSIECVKSPDGLREECSSTGDGYDDATYTLNITTETVQADAYQSVWKIDEIRSKYALFDYGIYVNKKLKKMANNMEGSFDYNTVNTNITAFKKADNEPDESIKTDDHLISSEKSNYPIYAWFDDGTIYWWSECSDVYFNSNSTSFLGYLTNLVDISGLEGINSSELNRLNYFFCDDSKITDFSVIENWDTSNVTTLYATFSNCLGLTTTDFFEDWNTSNVTTLNRTFFQCINLSSLDGLVDWDVSHVTTFNRTFFHCINIPSLSSISDWDVSSANSFYAMFYENQSLTSLVGLENWDTSNLVDMSYMFCGTSSFPMNFTSFEPISDWDVSKVENLTFTFQSSYGITSLIPLDNWQLDSLKSLRGTFCSCYRLTSLDGIENWNTSKVTTMRSLFHCCIGLMDASAIENWDVSKVTDMAHLFNIANNVVPVSETYSLLPELDLTKWNMESVVNYNWFMEDLRAVKTEMTINSSNVTIVNGAFSLVGCMNGGYAILNYVDGTESIVDSLVATKSNGCDVRKGVLKTN